MRCCELFLCWVGYLPFVVLKLPIPWFVVTPFMDLWDLRHSSEMEAFNVIESAISVLCSVSVSLSCGTVALSYCVLCFPYAFLSLPLPAFSCTCVVHYVVARVRLSDYVI